MSDAFSRGMCVCVCTYNFKTIADICFLLGSLHRLQIGKKSQTSLHVKFTGQGQGHLTKGSRSLGKFISYSVAGSEVFQFTLFTKGRHNNKQELSYRKQVARQLYTQYVEGIYDNPVTFKSRLTVTQSHWKRNHWIDHTRLTISRVIGC